MFKKKITQGLSVYKNKDEQSISNGKDAMKKGISEFSLVSFLWP